MKFSKIASALVASSLVIAPIAAQAGTRAGGSGFYPSATQSGTRASAAVANENSLAPALIGLMLVAASVSVFAVVEATDGQSPGAD